MTASLRKHIEEIISLTDGEFEHIQSHFVTKIFKKHRSIVQEGNSVDHEFFVLRGLVKAVFTDDGGKEHILQFAAENWWVTDYEAFIRRTAATLTIDCIEETELLSLSFADKTKLCAESHKMEHFFRIKTTRGYVSLQQRVLSLLNSDTGQKYHSFLEQYPALLQRIPKTMIAAYLGVSRETLSRLDNR